MIPFDFVYARPDTKEQAAEVYGQMQAEGKNPVYYSGGTEVITMCRAGTISPGGVVDLKSIPETAVLEMHGDKLYIGACCTLNKIKESQLFPMLGKSCGRIADHTNQCRITLGGNLCGTIIYRETSLPLLLCDAEALLFGPDGARTIEFSVLFDKRIQLKAGEFVLQIHVQVRTLKAPFIHVKKTANEKIDYPIVNVTAATIDGQLRVAFSGVCEYPFRSAEIEQVLSDRSLTPQARVDMACQLLPEPSYTDPEASGAYRTFVLKNTLLELLKEQSDGKI